MLYSLKGKTMIPTQLEEVLKKNVERSVLNFSYGLRLQGIRRTRKGSYS